jgi:hypothetical protein
MDQSSIVLFFTKRGFTAAKIERELKTTLDDEAMPDSIITDTLGSWSWIYPRPETVQNSFDDAIRQTLDEALFTSVKQIAHRLCQSPPPYIDA